MAFAHHPAEGVVRQLAFGRRDKLRGRLGAWDLQLGLIFHGDGRGDGIADGRKQQGWQQCSHGFTCAWLDVAKYSAIALTSSSVMALATPTIS